jgi:deoxyadenosine/deoxycytidine kinase
MSIYATKWKPITVEEYSAIWDESFHVYSGYTNLDGNDGLSSIPTLLTTWGDGEKELLKSVATRDRDFEPDTWDWRYKYWKAIEWEIDEDEQ